MVNNSNEITPDFEFEKSRHPSISGFKQAFQTLQNILSKTPKHFSLEATLPQTLTTPPTQITTPDDIQTPLSQATNPINPQYSATSTVSSDSLLHPPANHNRRLILIPMHITSYGLRWTLEDDLKMFYWFNGKYRLTTTFLSC
jgi:hypothetical protein